jgi:PleD family two-component response regulator
MHYQQAVVPVTITCGVAASDGKRSMDELLKEADTHLYRLKNNRKQLLV